MNKFSISYDWFVLDFDVSLLLFFSRRSAKRCYTSSAKNAKVMNFLKCSLSRSDYAVFFYLVSWGRIAKVVQF